MAAPQRPRARVSRRVPKEASDPVAWPSSAAVAAAQIDLSAAVPAELPARIEPMAATLASAPFDDDDWVFEVKWDGFRVMTIVDRGSPVRLLTRAGHDARTYFPSLLDDLGSWIDCEQAVLDGEMVALDENGRPDFSLLQERITTHRAGGGPSGLLYVVFDLLHLDGRSLLEVPLEERKKLLRVVLADNDRVRYAEHFVGEGRAFFAAAEAQGLEGMVAKRRRSRYEPGTRSLAWLKVKIRPEQELVVAGWTPSRKRADDLGSVVVGFYDDSGALQHAGRVGSGFTARSRQRMLQLLAPLVVADCPFAVPPPTDARGRWGGDLSGVTWVQPQVVVRAALGGWSRDGLVRQASYRGLELDRDPTTVTREVAAPSVPSESQPAANPVDDATETSNLDSAGDYPPATPAELATLGALPEKAEWELGPHTLQLTNLDKAIFSGRSPDEPPVTKRELIGYFARIAPAMLPHLSGRPLNLHRFPNGIERPGFWQKDMPRSTPDWLTLWHETGVEEDRAANAHLVADSAASLAWLGNQTAFEVHAWTSTCADPTRPTFALIDIDPGTATTWEQTLEITRLYRAALEHLGVRAYLKTTGARGLQAWIPVERGRYTFADTSGWVEALSRAVGAMVPDLVSWEWATKARGGRARLDYTQNAPIKTLVAPYAVRPRPGAPVSMPITWDELDDPDLRSDRWTIRDAPARVAAVGDLFAGAQTDAQVLPAL